MGFYLDFEKPIETLELKVEELKRLSDTRDPGAEAEIKKLQKKAEKLRTEIFSRLTRWQKTQLARHPERPYTLDYIGMLAEDFLELHGDRMFSDDASVVGGLGRVGGVPAMIIGHQKGRGVKERIDRNFGQPHPEGYRKSLRLMRLAEKFGKPVITFIDTPGAYPGIGAEERGQAEAIATNLLEMSRLRTPIIAVVIGEGGSGGALALGVSDRLYMLEHSIYSVISPEGCASILWRKNGNIGPEDFSKAADALRLTAQDLLNFNVIDNTIPEPLGGAHRNPSAASENIKETIMTVLQELSLKPVDDLLRERYERLRKVGSFLDEGKNGDSGS
jgi:acetyl-CoA carboxylase carboxyl transferase subunit alpha